MKSALRNVKKNYTQAISTIFCLPTNDTRTQSNNNCAKIKRQLL